MAKTIRKGLIGLSDIQMTPGSFSRGTSTGGTQSLSSWPTVVVDENGQHTTIAAAYAALPSTGGVIDARGLRGAKTFTSSVTIGSAAKPAVLLLGAVDITFTSAASNGFVISGFGSGIRGAGPQNTTITAGSGFTGSVVLAQPSSGNSISGLQLKGFRVELTAAPTAIGIKLLSVRDGSHLDHIEVRNGTGTALIIDRTGSTLSQGIAVSNFYVEVIGTKTADTMILRGDTISLFPNVKVVAGTLEGSYRGIVVDSSTYSTGRAFSMIGGAVANYAIGLDVVGSSGGTAPSGGYVAGVQFEQCTKGVRLSGLDASNKVQQWSVGPNYYLSVTTAAVELDYAAANTVMENSTLGSAGGINLTANSSANNIHVRYSSATTDVADAGTGNVIHGMITSGSVGRHILQGEVQILRNQTSASQWVWNDSGNMLPAADGQDIGSTSLRPDAFLQDVSVKRIKANDGTAHVAGDYALHANFGTGASVSAVAATDMGGRVTVTTGTTAGASPTLTLTFKDGTFTTAPAIASSRGDVQGTAAGDGEWRLTSVSATAAVWTFQGTPSDSTAYVLDFVVMGK